MIKTERSYLNGNFGAAAAYTHRAADVLNIFADTFFHCMNNNNGNLTYRMPKWPELTQENASISGLNWNGLDLPWKRIEYETILKCSVKQKCRVAGIVFRL